MNADLLYRIIQKHALWLLVVFHLIGLFIFKMPDRVEGLSALNILFCSLLVFFTSKDIREEWKYFLFIGLGGIFLEELGVNTGLLFGEYTYGNELGPKLLGVPLVLMLNWYCVVVASAHFVLKCFSGLSLFVQAFFAAILCTALDFVIEPVAIKYDFWQWAQVDVPVFNYICWFVFAFVFSFVYLRKNREVNNTACWLLAVWFLFFSVLNFI